MKVLPVRLACVACLFLLVGCSGTGSSNGSGASSSVPLLGGDRDAHGCIPSAGYQWCEAKQKCLRIWEEPCEGTGNSASSTVDTSNWNTYQNKTLGFSLSFPPSWDGYRATEGSYSTYAYVGFSFSGTHQPFELFKVMQYSREEWAKVEQSGRFTVLSRAVDPPLLCDGCCTQGGDTTGGGQFDSFQRERCAEVPQILQTFQRSGM